MAEPHRHRKADVNFLWLGETLLFPHIWPIVDRLAKDRPDLVIDLWISTSAHEDLVRNRINSDHFGVRICWSGFFRNFPDDMHGKNVPLPPKLPMLLSLLPHLFGSGPVIVAEQTSLWLPKLLPGLPPFIFTTHGAGPISHGRWHRLRAARKVMVPSALMAEEMRKHGLADDQISLTGHAKSAFVPSTIGAALFPEKRPIILYNPHWQPHRSSWPVWGRQLLEALIKQDRWNLIFAPHQRIVDTDDSVRSILGDLRGFPHVHADLDSFAMVDGSYTRMADMYLGDTSSQILEFIADPRPAVLLRPPELRWDERDSGEYGLLGECVTRFEDILPALDRAHARLDEYRDVQADYAKLTLGRTGDAATRSAVQVISEFLDVSPVATR